METVALGRVLVVLAIALLVAALLGFLDAFPGCAPVHTPFESFDASQDGSVPGGAARESGVY